MADAEKCNEDVYKHGVSVGLFDMPKKEAEAYCEQETLRTGRLHDWHYIGGRVHVKAMPEVEKQEEPKSKTEYEGVWG